MKLTLFTYQTLVVAVGFCVSIFGAAVRADDQPESGVFRITDTPPAEAVIQPATTDHVIYDGGYVGHPAYCDYGSPHIHERHVRPHTIYEVFGAINEDIRRSPVTHWFNRESRRFHARNNAEEATLKAHLLCKWGYFVPTGCCGDGCPIVGRYDMVYAVEPYHFDQRDGQIYAAQGTGVPMAVPLAPVVHHTYNYGWGVPSSRLTPISRIRR